MNMSEMYDNVYRDDKENVNEYYNTRRVLKLGEYAIQSLANNYKYDVLPHFIARGGDTAARFLPLDYLRRIRVSYFFKDDEFIDEINKFQEIYNNISAFILGSPDMYFKQLH